MKKPKSVKQRQKQSKADRLWSAFYYVQDVWELRLEVEPNAEPFEGHNWFQSKQAAKKWLESRGD